MAEHNQIEHNSHLKLPDLDEHGACVVWICDASEEPAFGVKFDMVFKPHENNENVGGIRMTIDPMPMDGHETKAVEVWSEG